MLQGRKTSVTPSVELFRSASSVTFSNIIQWYLPPGLNDSFLLSAYKNWLFLRATTCEEDRTAFRSICGQMGTLRNAAFLEASSTRVTVIFLSISFHFFYLTSYTSPTNFLFPSTLPVFSSLGRLLFQRVPCRFRHAAFLRISHGRYRAVACMVWKPAKRNIKTCVSLAPQLVGRSSRHGMR